MIILTILKILLLIILAILGFIIFLMLIILLTPIRYRGKASYIGKEPKLRVKITYLLHILSFTYDYEDGDFYIRIFGFKLGKRKEKTKKVQKKNVKTKKEKNAVKEEIKEEIKENIKSDIESKIEEKIKNENTGKKSIFSKIKNKFEKIKFEFLQKCDKISHSKKKFKKYHKFITSDLTKSALKRLKYQGFKLLKHIFPKKIKGRIAFGLKDPYYTGILLGFISIFYGITGKKLIFQPNFINEEIFLEGEIFFKGRIVPVVILYRAFKVYRIKRLREFREFIKRV